MYKVLKKAMWAFIYISVIVCISLSILRHLFPLSYNDIIIKYCNRYGVDVSLVSALAKAESNFNENSVSHANAKGIMQLTDDTFSFCKENADIKGSDIFDPDTNIHAGVWYISYLSGKYDGNTKNILAAYNAGMGNVDNWLGDEKFSSDNSTLRDVPFEETKHYIVKVNRYKTIYNILY